MSRLTLGMLTRTHAYIYKVTDFFLSINMKVMNKLRNYCFLKVILFSFVLYICVCVCVCVCVAESPSIALPVIFP